LRRRWPKISAAAACGAPIEISAAAARKKKFGGGGATGAAQGSILNTALHFRQSLVEAQC